MGSRPGTFGGKNTDRAYSVLPGIGDCNLLAILRRAAIPRASLTVILAPRDAGTLPTTLTGLFPSDCHTSFSLPLFPAAGWAMAPVGGTSVRGCEGL